MSTYAISGLLTVHPDGSFSCQFNTVTALSSGAIVAAAGASHVGAFASAINSAATDAIGTSKRIASIARQIVTSSIDVGEL